MSKEKKPKKQILGMGKGVFSLVAVVAVLMAVIMIASNIALPMFKNVVDVYMGWNIASKVDENAEPVENVITCPDTWDQAAAEAASEAIAAEGIILLKNQNGTLPLAAGRKLNVFGTASTVIFGGAGSGGASSANTITIAQGLAEAGFEVNPDLTNLYTNYNKSGHLVFSAADAASAGTGGYATGAAVDNNFDAGQYTALTAPDGKPLLDSAKAFSDTALVVFGRGGSEEIDMKYVDLRLSGNEQDLLRMVEENFDTVVVLVITPNCMELGILDDERVDAALTVGGPGQFGNRALGQVLNGTLNPSGRTADTWAYDLKSAASFAWFGPKELVNGKTQTWLYSNLNGTGMQNYAEGIYVGYRWYETAWAEGLKVSYDYADAWLEQQTLTYDFSDYAHIVQYPFGYGLSYTSFDWELADYKADKDTITMKVKVTNTGSAAGKDVVELYYTSPYVNSGIEKAHVVLGAFGKTGLLAPGASETVTLTLPVRDMASYDSRNAKTFVLEKGEYTLSLRTDAHTVKLDRGGKELTRTWKADSDVCYDQDEVTGYGITNRFDDIRGDIIYLSRADKFANFNDAIHVPTDEDRVAGEAILTVEADNSFQIGVGETITEETVMGAEGDLKLADMHDLPYDDPLWDKFMDQFTASQMTKLVSQGGYGTTSVADHGVPATSNQDGTQALKTTFAADGYVGIVYPPEMVLACTWNTEIAYDQGRMVAAEGNHTNVAGWYAPAMNTHRSPLGGRNYEYYSEDGFLAGKIGAQVSAGANDGGMITFVKHFAINEQETNRKSSYLFADEQAIREIYLRPFEITVKEGKTTAMMSAFNRIGTTWAGAHRGLLTEVLRNEWGFRGCVVTDYAEKPYQDGAQGIRAGNDLWLAGLSPAASIKADRKANPNTANYYLRQAAKNVCYAVGNSEIAMNGLSSKITFSEEISGSDIALNVINIVGGAFFGLLALYILIWYIRKRQKKA